MSVEFESFDVPGARAYHGNTYLYGLRVKDDKALSVADAAASLRSLAESGKIGELLDRHGAVLVRGIGHSSVETFAELVNAVEEVRASHPFEQIGLAGKRTPLAKNVWTANEGSPTTRFYQHNETADKGGSTPVANSAAVFERVLAEVPELVKGIEQRGLGMKMLFRAPGSESLHNGFNCPGEYSFGQEFQPGDDEETRRRKAEKQVRRLTHDFKWLEDGSLELTQHIPGLRRLPNNGRPVWFNGLVGRHGITRDIGALEPPYIGRDGMTYLPCVYGDETPIPREYLDKLIEVIDKEEIHLRLEEGDLLLVDNLQVSHGREPWEGGRLVLVSMWDGARTIEAY